ncbi:MULTISPECIES: hypothetical protein [Cyanophyceae]|nr:hypothetical protein [Trichocoleus sp. FACHB-69]
MSQVLKFSERCSSVESGNQIKSDRAFAINISRVKAIASGV